MGEGCWPGPREHTARPAGITKKGHPGMALVYATVIFLGLLWAGLLASIAPDGNGGRAFIVIAGLGPPAAICAWIAANGPYG